ncbi:MAG: hypothetical protein IPJ13_30545 [Saprospiraceae bacterium]|nr:hypothetical protein [Saprospiraceae bacterium]
MTINILSMTTPHIMDVYMANCYTQQTISEGQNTINLSSTSSRNPYICGRRPERFKVLKE